MTVQLDESVPARLAQALIAHDCDATRFPDKWKGLKNGVLLARLRENETACLVTCDKNLQHQQTISTSGLALVVLPYQRFGDLQPLLGAIARAIKQAMPGAVVEIGRDGTISGPG